MLLAVLSIITASLSVHAYTPPNHFPMSHRGGSLYRESVALHEELSKTHGIIGNSTANYFDQMIDHANPTVGTFRQKFYVDYTYSTGDVNRP